MELAELARARGMLFLSTPLDLASAAFVEPLVDAYKVASGDNDFLPLLDALGATGKPVVFSSGLSDIEGVRATVARLRGGGHPGGPRSRCCTA